MIDEGKLSIPFFPDTEDIRQGTKKLTNMICHTEDYKCYQKDLAVLKEQEQYFEKIESLHSEYKDVLTEPVVVDFLSAEQRMCKLMRLVYDGIAEDIKLDLSYMDEL